MASNPSHSRAENPGVPEQPSSAYPYLTASRLRTVRTCQRLHHFMYGLGYKPTEEPEALRFGSLIHDGLEAWWLAPDGERLDRGLAAMAEESEPVDRIRAEELLRAYDLRWKEEPYEVLAVEQRFDTELRNPVTGQPSRLWRLAGRVDAVVRDLRDGRVLLMEHKTASGEISGGSDYWRRLRVDAQVSLYFEGARSLGFDVDGCLYDVLKKPSLRPLKATPLESRKLTRAGTLYAHQRAEDEELDAFRLRLRAELSDNSDMYFQRREVVRFDNEILESLLDIWELGKQMREAERAGRAPRNPDACFQFGRSCPFFGVCAGEASLDDTTQYTRRAFRMETSSAEDGQQPKEEAAP